MPDGKSLVAACSRGGFDSLERLDLSTGKSEPIPALADYTQIDSLAVSQTGSLAIVASAHTAAKTLSIALRIVLSFGCILLEGWAKQK